MRFYDASAGSVLIDGRNIGDYSVKWLRESIGLIPQQPVLLPGTVGENIARGSPGATPAEIQTAAKDADAHHFICRLPHGYDTCVGAHGGNLSGGQRQRIAIAQVSARRLQGEAMGGKS